ncbi:MAG TPA: FISUMP domain-containing protein [Cyclobacteriaceae bacterium]
MKKNILLFLIVIIRFQSLYAQFPTDRLIDVRDGKEYRIKTINNTTWMLDNLDYESKNSVGLTEEQQSNFKNVNLHGRYYHFTNIDSVCPTGWRIPNTQDWIDYFNFLVKESPKKIKLEMVALEDENYYFSFLNYEKRIDLFKIGNPLNLNPTGRIEGGKFNVPTMYADYYTTDSKETFKGKSHIHIMNAYTTVHSHEHNLQLDKEEELRKFMVRCAK